MHCAASQHKFLRCNTSHPQTFLGMRYEDPSEAGDLSQDGNILDTQTKVGICMVWLDVT